MVAKTIFEGAQLRGRTVFPQMYYTESPSVQIVTQLSASHGSRCPLAFVVWEPGVGQSASGVTKQACLEWLCRHGPERFRPVRRPLSQAVHACTRQRHWLGCACPVHARPNFGRSRHEQLCRTDARQPSIRPDTTSRAIRRCMDCRLFWSGLARIGKPAIRGRTAYVRWSLHGACRLPFGVLGAKS